MDADRNEGATEMHKDKLTAELAYRLWQENGSVEGRALDYWLEAERKLRDTDSVDATRER
jgi:hypothetical protein